MPTTHPEGELHPGIFLAFWYNLYFPLAISLEWMYNNARVDYPLSFFQKEMLCEAAEEFSFC